MLKLPRITVSVDFENGDGNSGNLGMEALGYGLHQAWIYLAMFSTADIFQLQDVATGMYGTSTSATLPISLLIFGVCLIVFGLDNQRFVRLFASGKAMAAGAALTALGTLALAFSAPDLGPSINLTCEVVSGIATGLGTALLIIYWGIIFSNMNLSSIVLNTTIAIILAFVVFVCIYVALPAKFTPYLTAFLPLLEIPVLAKRTPNRIARTTNVPYFRSLPIHRNAFAASFLPSVILFGLALGVLRQISVQNVVTLATMQDSSMPFLLACIAAILVMLLILSTARSNANWKEFFRPLLPVLIIAAICLPYAVQGTSLLTPCFLLVAYLFFEMSMWIYFSTLAESYRLSPIMVFGLGRGCLALSALVSFFAFSWMTSAFASSTYGATGTVVVMLVIIFCAFLALPTSTGFKSLYDTHTSSDACANHLFEASIASINESLEENAPARVFTEQSASEDNSEAQSEGKADDQRTEESMPASSNSDDGSDDDDSVGAETKPALNASSSKVNLTNGSGDIALTADEHLACECEAVANTYLLSRREAEVCFLLARGHNSSYIQEKLFISEGTAKTHTRHIYRKLDIHSQEELIRLVESFADLV